MAAAQFPTVTVNIGFLASSGAGGIGPYLTFNDATWGQFDTGEFAGDLAWTDVTADVRSVTTMRGRQRQIDAFSAGTCSLVLDNNSGNYDPDNPASPFHGDLLPMRPIQIIASWNGTNYPLFYGYFDQIVPSYSPGKYSDAWTTISATDAMKVFNNLLSAGSYGIETSGARVGHLLDSISWVAALRNIATGDELVQASAPSSTIAQDIQTVADSEGGRWYIGADGSVVFESRSGRLKSQTAAATWTDSDTTGLLYTGAQRNLDDDLLRNFVTVTNAGGTPQSAEDGASIVQYQQRTYSLSGTLLIADSDARELAKSIVYQDSSLPQSRFDQVSFEPLGDPTNLWPEVLGRKISDRVNIVTTPPNVSPITLANYVENVAHAIDFEHKTWDVTFACSPAWWPPFLIFDDATFGKFDTDAFAF